MLSPRGALYIGRNEDEPAIAAFIQRFAESGVSIKRLARPALEQRIPGLRGDWRHAVSEPACADIDVAGLHQHYLARARRGSVELRCRARLDSLEGAVSAPETVAALRRRHADRRAYFVAACQGLIDARDDAINTATQLQLRFVDAERAAIADIYTRGEIDDEARRRIERELDLEDARLRHAGESGAARLA